MSNKLEFYSNFKTRFEPDPLVKYYTAEEFNVERTPIEVKCKKNVLRGFDYNPNSEIKDCVVVFAHGMWTTIDAYNQDICYLCNNGFEVIAVNNTGVGPSEGKSLEGLGQCLKSLDAVLDYVENNPKYKGRKIYVMGHSWGAHAVCNICHYHKNISKIVALAPYASEYRLLKGMMDKNVHWIIPFLLIHDYMKVGSYSRQNSYKNLKNFKGETLILHSTDDPLVNFDLNTKWVKEKLPNLNYLILNDRAHNPNYKVEAIKIMKDYLNTIKTLNGEDLDNYKKNFNFAKMGELDNSIMDKIVEFLKK